MMRERPEQIDIPHWRRYTGTSWWSMIKTLCFHCKEHRFDLIIGPACHAVWPKNKSIKRGGHSDGKQVYKRCHASCLQGIANFKQQWDPITHLLEWPNSKILTTPNAGEAVEQEELTFTVGRKTKWYRYFGRQFGNLLQNWTCSYHMIQQSYPLVFTQRNWKLMSTQKPAHGCL